MFGNLQRVLVSYLNGTAPAPDACSDAGQSPNQSQSQDESWPEHMDDEAALTSGDKFDAGKFTGDLLRYDVEKGCFERILKRALAEIVDGEAKFESRLLIWDRRLQKKVVEQNLDQRLQLNFDRKNNAIVWVLQPMNDIDEENEEVFTMKFQFENECDELQFKEMAAIRLFEASRQESFDKTGSNDYDREWVIRGTDQAYDSSEEDVEMEDAEMLDFDHSGSTSRPLVIPVTKFRHGSERHPSKNTELAQGMSSNRSFVVRGSSIGVFSHDGLLPRYVGKIEHIRASSGQHFSPSRVLLRDQDHKMVMLNPNAESTVYELDLEKQQLVQEFQALDDMPIRDLAPSTRYAPQSHDPTLVGVNRKSIFNIDLRLASKSKWGGGFVYKSAPRMSVISSTSRGGLVTGAETGELRMFSDHTKRAKTLLPGLGDEIISLDVTNDSKWILATTIHYLLVIPTTRSDGQTGFQISMGNEKPTPFKLQILPQDLALHGIRNVSFRPARFEMGNDISEEHWIVTATGAHLITWNFRQVKQGRLSHYQIKHCPQVVVEDQFRFNNPEQVIVALPDDFLAENRTIRCSQLSRRTKR